MRYLLLILAWLLAASPACAQQMLWLLRAPAALPPPAIYLDFVRNWGYVGATYGAATSLITVSRVTAASMTDLGPWSAQAASFNTFSGANTARLTPGRGLLIEGVRTNFLTNSATPATQTSVALTSGSVYVLWVNGSGSAATANTGGCGTSVVTATQGNPATFTAQASSGCLVTITGSLNAFQLEGSTQGPFGSSLITTAGISVLRQTDVVTVNTPPATSAAGYTVMVKAMALSPDAVATIHQITVQISDGTNTNRTMMFRTLSTNTSSFLDSGGVAGQVTGLQMHPLIPAKHAAIVGVNEQISTQDGANPQATLTAFTPFATGLNTINIGGNITANSQPCDCYIQQVQIWPSTLLSPSQLQQLTRLSGS